jgi:hypothetical protein
VGEEERGGAGSCGSHMNKCKSTSIDQLIYKVYCILREHYYREQPAITICGCPQCNQNVGVVSLLQALFAVLCCSTSIRAKFNNHAHSPASPVVMWCAVFVGSANI